MKPNFVLPAISVVAGQFIGDKGHAASRFRRCGRWPVAGGSVTNTPRAAAVGPLGGEIDGWNVKR
jgi:hypothetical protein